MSRIKEKAVVGLVEQPLNLEERQLVFLVMIIVLLQINTIVIKHTRSAQRKGRLHNILTLSTKGEVWDCPFDKVVRTMKLLQR
jgi:hypothetical protein